MQEERQEKEPEIPEEHGTAEGVDDPSLDEEQPAEETEPVASDEEEGQLADEDTDEAELIGEVEDDELFAEEPPRRHGCLIGCFAPIAVIFAVVLIIVAIGYLKRDAIQQGLLKRIVANTQNDVFRNLPEDMDKNQIEKEFEEVKLALKEGRGNAEALAEAIEEYQDVIGERPSIEQRKQAIKNLMTDLSAAITPGGE